MAIRKPAPVRSGRNIVRSLVLATSCISGVAHAGDLGGVVTSGSLDRPVRGATVSIDGSGVQVATDENGRYRIANLPAATYNLRIQQPGYDDHVEQVIVPQTGTAIANATLFLAAEEQGGAIVVTGARASRLLALERKRALPVIADVVSADAIGKLPDYNTAEALQRLPGISVTIDQGEPRYVVIRGVDPNLNQVTVDGNLVGIPEAEGRRVALDTIPSDLVAAIEVVKTITPDYDANAIGGSINIVTPTAFDRGSPFTFATARGAYNDKSSKLGFGGSLTHGRRFGPDETLGIAVGASYFKRFIDSDLAEPRNWRTIGDLSTPTSFRLYDYRIIRERIGGVLNLDWRPNPDVRLYVRNIYNEFTDEEERDQFDFAFAGGTPSFPSATQISFSSGRATREFRQNDQTQKLYNISPGAELRSGIATLELNYTYAHAQEHTPVRDDIEFRSATGKTSTLDLSGDLPVFSAIDPSLFDPAAFPLRRVRIRRETIDETLHSGRIDMQFDFAPDSFFKAGLKYIDRTKDRDNAQSQTLPTRSLTLAETGAVLPPPEDFYEGLYSYGPTIDYSAFFAYLTANPARFRLDETTTAFNEISSDYDIREKIYAAYAMANVSLGDLTAIGGLRVEQTEGRYNAFAIRDTDGNGVIEPSDATPLSFNQEYTHVLPSLHLIYRPIPEFILRGAWTNTIGRPNYDATVPTFEEEDGDGTAGNPDLEPYTSMGLDLSAEYYPDADSIFSVAVFYKQIENPVFTRMIMNTSFAGVPLLSLSQPQNADGGELLGIEANIVRRLTFLPAPFDGFGVSANATYVDSSVTVPGREDEDIPFFRQSDWIASGALFYEKGPFEARIAVSYRDDAIVNIGSSTASDIYDKARTVLDARVSYRVMKGLEVFTSVSNINEAPLTFFQTNPDQVFSRQIYGVNADFGVSATF